MKNPFIDLMSYEGTADSKLEEIHAYLLSAKRKKITDDLLEIVRELTDPIEINVYFDTIVSAIDYAVIARSKTLDDKRRIGVRINALEQVLRHLKKMRKRAHLAYRIKRGWVKLTFDSRLNYLEEFSHDWELAKLFLNETTLEEMDGYVLNPERITATTPKGKPLDIMVSLETGRNFVFAFGEYKLIGRLNKETKRD